MLHLLVLRYLVAEHEAEPHVAEHVRFLERHHRAGTFLVSGQTVPSAHGGAILARGVDRAAVERITTEDPFVRAGVAEYMVTTIDPGRVHPALAELLGVGASRVRPSLAGGVPRGMKLPSAPDGGRVRGPGGEGAE